MAGITDNGEDFLKIAGDIDADHLGSRNHDVPNPGFGKVENAMQHPPLFRRDHPRLFSDLNHGPNLVLRDGQALRITVAHKAGQQS